MLGRFFFFVVVAGSLSAEREETNGKCEFTHDCDRPDNLLCSTIQDASCVCNQGNCIIRGHHIFGPRITECKTYKDCKKSGRCNGIPDSQCFCIDALCETSTQWECHESRNCTTMDKCKGKECTCRDGTCEWNCYTDDDCINGPFYCDPLGWRCKCQRSLCDLVKLPTQCTESSPNSLKECVDKKFCKKDQACECLQDYCTKPWYVEDNIRIPGGAPLNCRTTIDCTDTILDCANGSCTCGNMVNVNEWTVRGTCIKKSTKKPNFINFYKKNTASAVKFPQ